MAIVIGNWKMNGLQASRGFAADLRAGLGARPLAAGAVLGVCPPATLLADLARDLSGTGVALGGQDCHPGVAGAHTGDVSAQMLADAGATLAIVGHSERRADHGETSAQVAAKAAAAQQAGLSAIVCVGETEAERDAGRAESVVLGQLQGSIPGTADLARLIVAYEPVWAIGTGRVATVDDVAAMHGAIRAALAARFGVPGGAIAILYGGSVKPDNAGALFAVADVAGGLVGGASLKASDLLAIARA